MATTLFRTSAIALSAAALFSFAPLPALATSSTLGAPASATNQTTAAPSAAQPSSAEPAPTPSPSASQAAAPSAPAPASKISEAAAPTNSPTKPSLAEPAPTPGWAQEGPGSSRTAELPRARAHHPMRHQRGYASREARGYVRYESNPVASATRGVANGVADLGSIAAYPVYCFPNYGSCPLHWYR